MPWHYEQKKPPFLICHNIKISWIVFIFAEKTCYLVRDWSEFGGGFDFAPMENVAVGVDNYKIITTILSSLQDINLI